MPDRPNILWITTDQQRYDTIHALGNEHIRTPNLDRLCAEGTAFTHAYCQNPICTPSRSSFLTGLYPSVLPGNINGNEKPLLPEGVELITKRLADAGYRCGLSGKLHLASGWNGVEERADDGYDVFHYSHSPCQTFDRSNEYVAWLEDQGMLDRVFDASNHNPKLRRGVTYRPDVPFELHQTTWCCDRAIDFMKEQQDRPWLFSVNIFDPHTPMDPPQEYRRRYDPDSLPPPIFTEQDPETQEKLSTHIFQNTCNPPGDRELREKAGYYAMIELIDENVGRLLAALEETGQRENTIVIFTSDHGDMLGDHGLRAKGCRFYEGLVRVPLIFSWPGRFKRGLKADGLVELTDLAPTLADLAGIEPAWTHGKSLLPILEHGEGKNHHHEYVRCEFYDTVDMNFGKKNREAPPPSFATMYRDERWKLCVYHGNDYGELYDMTNDPDELNNLWEDPRYADTKQRLLRASFDKTVTSFTPPVPRMGRF